MNRLIAILVFLLIARGQIAANCDQAVLHSNILVISKIVNIENELFKSDAPRGIYFKFHYRLLVTQLYKTNWVPTETHKYPDVGDTLDLNWTSLDTIPVYKRDSFYFFPFLCRDARTCQFTFGYSDTLNLQDTSLYWEYSLRLHPGNHISFPIYHHETIGKWQRTNKYSADSILLSTFDRRTVRKPRSINVYKLKAKSYANNGKVQWCVRQRTKYYSWADQRNITWYFREKGRPCLKMNRNPNQFRQ